MDWGTLFVRGSVWLIVPFEGRDLSFLLGVGDRT